MSLSRRDMHAFHRTTNALHAEVNGIPPEAGADLSTHQFTQAAIEIMALPDAEFRARLHEFGFAASAIVTRIARMAQ